MKTLNHNSLHFPIIIEKDEDIIYIISCPVFKGCHSYGKTIEEAMNNIKVVIEMCLEEEKESKEKTCKNKFIGFRELMVNEPRNYLLF